MTPQDEKESPEIDLRRLEAAFVGSVPAVKVSFQYQLGLFLVALAMILLPLIYLGIIAAVCYGLHYHITEGAPGKSRGGFFVYMVPVVVGPIIVVFMIKPLFARRVKRGEPLSLRAEEEPILFRFVEKICATIGAPLPRRIDVDCQVNASASFRRGLWSMFGSDLVLTIGLPLVAGLNLRQLAGVLAHEFGHFAQGSGMRLTYVIRTVNGWFARVVYERDTWDAKLVQWSEEWDLRLGVFLYIARVMIWLTRRILWCLMMCGHAISSFMLRQMEFDADRYEARFAGSDVFRSTALRLPLLGLSSNAAFSSLQQSWQDKHLGDEFPALVVARLGEMPDDVRDSVLKSTLETKTGTFDSHPADSDRIRSAADEKAPGVFQLEVTATSVFRDFSSLSKRATLLLYRDLIGDEVTPANLVPTADLVERHSVLREEAEAYARFSQNCYDDDAVIELDEDLSKPEDFDACAARLKALRGKFEPVVEKAQKLVARRAQEEGRRLRAVIGQSYLRAGIDFRPRDLGVKSNAPAGLKLEHDDAAAKCDAIRDRLRPVYEVLNSRVSLALRLMLALPPEKLRGKFGLSHQEIESLIESARAIVANRGDLDRFFETSMVNRHLADQWSNGVETEDLFRAIQKGVKRWVDQLGHLAASFETVWYPFSHAGGEVSVAVYAIDSVPSSSADINEVYGVAGEAADRLFTFVSRVRHALGALAERVETELCGIERLPEPAEEGGEAA